MSFSVGIVGLPNAGKSTLFKALTKNKVDIASYPFTTIDPNIGLVPVPDNRLEKIASIVKPKKSTKTIIEFVDIAGLVKGAHKGEGLGNQFLGNIRECDAIVEVIRAFEDSNVEHIEGEINPEKDIKTIENELLMKDLETAEKAIDKTDNKLLKRIQESLSSNKLIKDLDLTNKENAEIKEYQFLTAKPIVYMLNFNKEVASDYLAIDLKIEEEASELSRLEAEELDIKSKLDQLITACYNILDLITFFTIIGTKETRAWTLKKGSTAIEAAGKVHSDFQEKFIRAEVLPWQELIKAQSWTKAKESGKVRTAGKEYIVKDGDIIEFKI